MDVFREAVIKKTLIMANYLSKDLNLKIRVFNKLHGKKFVKLNVWHKSFYGLLLKFERKKPFMSLVSILMFRICPCPYVAVYVATDNTVPYI